MYILFDIGGTKIRIGLATDTRKILRETIYNTPQDFQSGASMIHQMAIELCMGEKIACIAGGIAGPIDSKKERLMRSPHLPLWVNKPLKKTLQDFFHADVILENDAVLNGLGEAVYGAGKNYEIIGYITVSTGVGGSKIVSRKIDAHSIGFEPGHQIIDINGPLCPSCQQRGHLESYISGSALFNKYGIHADEIQDTAVWNQVTEYLSIGLVNSILHWSPDVIILGGSVSKRISIPKLQKMVKDKLTIFTEIPEIIPASLGELSGLYGGLSLIGHAV